VWLSAALNEMIPKISVKKRSNVGPALFGTNSALMMTLDVVLGA